MSEEELGNDKEEDNDPLSELMEEKFWCSWCFQFTDHDLLSFRMMKKNIVHLFRFFPWFLSLGIVLLHFVQ